MARSRTLVVVRILLATDGSPGAVTALRFMLSLPFTSADRVTVLSVQRDFTAAPDGNAGGSLASGPDLRRDAAQEAGAVSASFAERGVATAAISLHGPVSEAIERAALERSEELVVIGSRSLGAIGGGLPGGISRALVNRARVSLLVVRGLGREPRRILAAVDGSAESDVAIDLLRRLPLPANVEITLLHVLRQGAASERADEALSRAGRTLRRPVARSIVERGDPTERVVLRALVGDADVIILGWRGRDEAHGFLPGGVTHDVLRRAHCAVLIAKPPLAPQSVGADSHTAGRAFFRRDVRPPEWGRPALPLPGPPG
jgi:nucleotide-binding universal stress UspA family protein